MTTRPPWEVGTHEERWEAYFTEPGSEVLRNRVGAVTVDELAAAEDDLFEYRLLELRENPSLSPRTFDLDHLQAIHHHLFQDVYEWAGDLRTVGIAKGGGESFMPPREIERPMAHVAQRIVETQQLRAVPAQQLPSLVAYLYDFVNFAHPFRDGNGRAQREFFAQLLSVSGHGLDWTHVEKAELHAACHAARNDDDIRALTGLFQAILNDEPSY